MTKQNRQNRPDRTRAPATTAPAAEAPATPTETATTDLGAAIDPSTRNTGNTATAPVERPASPADTGENLANADTTNSASPTAGSPTAEEAQAAADKVAAGDHGAAKAVGTIGDAEPPAEAEQDHGDGLVNGLRVAVAFQDATTGQRVAPGDPIPAHILADDDRMGRLAEGGFITDKPEVRAPATAVPGGTLTVSHSRDEDSHGAAQPLGNRRPAT